jgi:DNA-binding MarR family transcriptional regulator
MSACPSNDTRVKLFGLLRETSARLDRTMGHELEDSCGLPLPWFEVLLNLRRSESGVLTMTEIADAIVHSNAGTTRLIDRLESSQLVCRQSCPNDRRAIHVAITSAGNQKLDEALDAHVQHVAHHVSSRLTAEERAELTRILGKLNADA